MFAVLLALQILLLPAAASAAPIPFGDIVVLTGSSVVRLERANGYAPDPQTPITTTDPRAVEVAPSGSVYVLDHGTGVIGTAGIVELANDGTQRPFTPIGTRPWGANDEEIDVFLAEPLDMAFGRDGRLWVADQGFRRQDPDWGFDGNVIFVDPATDAIASNVGPGTSPRLIDIGPFAGAVLLPNPANLVVLWADQTPEPEPFGFRGCDGCDGLLLLGSPSVLRDGRIVVNSVEIGPESGLFGEKNVADVSVFDSTGLLLDVFVDLGLFGKTAGGIGDEFFFMDSPTSIARFDLETGISTPIYDAGVPILDLAVQQIPEPGALWMLATGAALTLRRKLPGSARRWPGP